MKRLPHAPTIREIEDLRGAHRDSQPPPREQRPQRNAELDKSSSKRVPFELVKHLKRILWRD